MTGTPHCVTVERSTSAYLSGRYAPRMAAHILAFERPVVELVTRVRELRDLASTTSGSAPELERLEEKAAHLAREVFANLSPMQKVQLSRHPNRPVHARLRLAPVQDFVELHGDRRFADDAAIVAGLARFHGRSVVVVGHQKGRGTKENVQRNFGMPHPEGYRKAHPHVRARRALRPARPHLHRHARRVSAASAPRSAVRAKPSARRLEVMSRAPVPIIATVIGEGGSGGALALGVANRVLVLEFGYYSVISPEGCAAILWKSADHAAEAAARLKITAPNLLELGVVDAIVDEPPGGAHQDHDDAARLRRSRPAGTPDRAFRLSNPDELREDRYQRFRRLGRVRGVSWAWRGVTSVAGATERFVERAQIAFANTPETRS